ncbi:type II secretion system protein GspG [Andreprevotia lacus]|uniref:type II secretion system protein GspG n=1 Tax=Andreprevotia lacus TaxID=1121000 RepID=UPI000A02F8ED
MAQAAMDQRASEHDSIGPCVMATRSRPRSARCSGSGHTAPPGQQDAYLAWLPNDAWDHPFRYRPEQPELCLYSMGPDGVDNGGKGDDIAELAATGLASPCASAPPPPPACPAQELASCFPQRDDADQAASYKGCGPCHQTAIIAKQLSLNPRGSGQRLKAISRARNW